MRVWPSHCFARTTFGSTLLFIATVLSGCGPAPSDEASNTESRASVAGPGDRLEARGTGQGESHRPPFAPRGLTELAEVPAPRAASLIVPDWIATDLASPDAQVRLKAVETWGQSAPAGSVDPLVQALEDKDEHVQARALELIVQDWARAQAAEER